jgi:hypothetical protein
LSVTRPAQLSATSSRSIACRINRPVLHEFAAIIYEGCAQAFMAGLARSIELQRADLQAGLAYKSRLIDYLERPTL